MPFEFEHFEISADRSRLDFAFIHRHLAATYWAKNLSFAAAQMRFANAVAFGVYAADGAMVGFGRAVTDRCSMAYLSDIFIAPDFRGHGLGKRLIEAMLAHPDLSACPWVFLVTLDAHEVYRPFGFTAPPHPDRFMLLARNAPLLIDDHPSLA